MYNKPMLSLDQVQRAMAAMLEKATQQPNQPVAIAIVDDGGSLVSYARMDRCRAIPQRWLSARHTLRRCRARIRWLTPSA
jgi:uncharacterized protein GlcG (DUF336 family)